MPLMLPPLGDGAGCFIMSWIPIRMNEKKLKSNELHIINQ